MATFFIWWDKVQVLHDKEVRSEDRSESEEPSELTDWGVWSSLDSCRLLLLCSGGQFNPNFSTAVADKAVFEIGACGSLEMSSIDLMVEKPAGCIISSLLRSRLEGEEERWRGDA